MFDTEFNDLLQSSKILLILFVYLFLNNIELKMAYFLVFWGGNDLFKYL